MAEEELKRKVDEVLKIPAEELKGLLPSTLEEINKYGVEKLMEEVPDLLAKIIGKLEENDIAKFANEAPEVLGSFMNVLWQGVGVFADKSDELRPLLESVGEINVNLEATDSPLVSHFKVSGGKLSGSSGLLHFREQDFMFFGPTKFLMGLLRGDVPLGLATWTVLNYQGNPGFLSRVGPILEGISKIVREGGR